VSQFKIDDLNFCESELKSESQVKGGFGYSTSYDTSKDSAKASGYIASYYVDRSNLSYGYVLAGGVSGAVAGGVAGAITVGGVTYSYTGAVASAY